MTWFKQPKPRCGGSHYGGLRSKRHLEVELATMTAIGMAIFGTLDRNLLVSKVERSLSRESA